jgi:Caspase domain
MDRPTIRAALLLAALSLPATARGQSPGIAPQDDKAKGRQWALLIGVEKYEKARPLAFTINDVRTLSKTLRARDGVAAEQLLAITDDESDPARRPTKAAMLETIPRWLARIGRDDRLIVYFSGHGFRDPAGKLYLAPIDVDPADPASTGLPVEWFRRQIADCKADFKLLILDACHSGSEKGEGERDVPSKDIGDQFAGLERVVTMASSTGEEMSQIWDAKEQSLYSYWLNQALKGHADSDGDGDVDIDELHKYLHQNVTRTAKKPFRPQNPVRSVRVGVDGSPVVVRVSPSDLKTLLNDMAEQLALAAGEKEVKKVGVLQFSGHGARGELIGVNYGTLGQFCSNWLEKRLLSEGNGAFEVTNGQMLEDSLKRQGVGLDDLENRERMEQVSKAMNGLPSLAKGSFLSRVGQVVTIQCRLTPPEGAGLIGSAGGVALLNASEWAMLGGSGSLAPADVIGPPPSLNDTGPRDPQATLVAALDQKATEPHPLTNPSFEFPVKIMVGGQERKGSARGNLWVVPLRKGETYEVWVGNRTGRPICMRMLVDGLNTLPDYEMAPKNAKSVATLLWGQHVDLADARHWALDPTVLKSGVAPVWAVRGFVTVTGEEGKLREFVMGTAEQSLAAKRKFTDQVGLITVALYDPAVAVAKGPATTRGGGTVAGKERVEYLKENGQYVVGEPRAMVNIRYVDADEPNAAAALESIVGPPPAPMPAGLRN